LQINEHYNPIDQYKGPLTMKDKLQHYKEKCRGQRIINP